MSYFLRDKDYNGQIREVNLGQVQVDTESRRTMELVAQAELTSYLSNRYECDIAFAPLLAFSDTDEYKWQDRIDLTLRLLVLQRCMLKAKDVFIKATFTSETQLRAVTW